MWLLSNKVKVIDSGLLEGFCDYHCHLLPGVDDGVPEKNEALDILRLWEQLGMKEIWLTPHIMEDVPNTPATLRSKFEEVTAAYKGDIQLHLAAEHMMDGLFLKRLGEGEVMPFNVNVNVNDNQNQNDNEKLLVETSYYTPPMNMGAIIERIKEKGYEPILAHPER